MADTFSDLIAKGAGAATIAAHLDGLPPARRVDEVLGMPGNLQPKLFDSVKDQGSVTLDTFVEATGDTVIYELKNNLPAFNVSQKRFFRPEQGEVIGYNHTGGVAAFFAGPGYFYAVDGEHGELVFDYTRLPTLQPPGWPEILPNKGMLRGVTYGNMLDYCWPVSKHTVIGAAFKDGKPRNAYFILTRAASQS